MSAIETAIQKGLLTRDKGATVLFIRDKVYKVRSFKLRPAPREGWFYAYAKDERTVRRLTKKEKTQMAMLMAAHDRDSDHTTEIEDVGQIWSFGKDGSSLRMYLIVERWE